MLSQFRLTRVILALVLLQLICSSDPVEARHRLPDLHRRQSFNWGWPLQNLFNLFNPRPPTPAPSPPPPPPPPPPAPLPVPSSEPSPVSPPADPPAPPALPTFLPSATPPQSSTPAPASSTSRLFIPSASASNSQSITAPPVTPAAVATPQPTVNPTAPTLPVAGNQTSGGCSNPSLRPEWRSLSRQQQTNYIAAVKCLARLPSKLLPGGDYRRYDDFENVHSRMRTRIHWMAIFLPWHRHFMFLFEQSLRNECGYTGYLPRWDWTLDSNDMTRSPIWSSDPMVGFGSNGLNFTDVSPALDGGVVTDGAFANWNLYYPEYHQLQRNYNLPYQYRAAGRSWGSQFFDQAAIARVQSQTSYANFEVAIEGTDPSSTGPSNPGPHSIIHVVIGGDISPTSYAANEPLFYLHHANVDYHWWRWQNAQRSTRLKAYGGATTRGSTQNTARLTDSLSYLGLSADIRVQDTMDTYSGQYCYTY